MTTLKNESRAESEAPTTNCTNGSGTLSMGDTFGPESFSKAVAQVAGEYSNVEQIKGSARNAPNNYNTNLTVKRSLLPSIRTPYSIAS